MGVVWLARSRADGELVAIKTILPSLSHSTRARRRFVREARAAFRLQHPHIIRLLDFRAEESSQLAMIMEYFPSETLAAFRARRPGWPEIRSIVLQVLDGLSLAHSLGVVHRDLKPENILVGPDPLGAPMARIADFGIAQLQEVDGRRSTGRLTGSSLLGTPPYMAPEQLFYASDVGASADVYAVGVMLFELLTGQLPFPGRDPRVLLGHKMGEVTIDFEPLPYLDLPNGVREVVLKSLRVHPLERHLFAADFFRHLERLPDGPSRGVEWEKPVEVPEGEPTHEWALTQRVLPETLSMGAVRAGPGSQLVVREPALVGREHEMDCLLASLREVLETQSPKALLLRGPSGIGKSRLMDWLRSVVTLDGAALPLVLDAGQEGLVYALRGALLQVLACGRIQQLPSHEWLHLGLQALGAQEQSELQEQLTALLQTPKPTTPGSAPAGMRTLLLHLGILRRLARMRPLCLLLEGSGPQAVHQLVGWMRWMRSLRLLHNTPVLLVATTTSVTEELSLAEEEGVSVLDLGRLSDEQAMALLGSLALDPARAEALRAGAAGHPLALIEGAWCLECPSFATPEEGLETALQARFAAMALPPDRREELEVLLGLLACGPQRALTEDVVRAARTYRREWSETRIQNLLWLASNEKFVAEVEAERPMLEFRYGVWHDLLRARALARKDADLLRRAWVRTLDRPLITLPDLEVRAEHLLFLSERDNALALRVEAIDVAQRQGQLATARTLLDRLVDDLSLFEGCVHLSWVRGRIVLRSAELHLLEGETHLARQELHELRTRRVEVHPALRLEAELWGAEAALQSGEPVAAGRMVLDVHHAISQSGTRRLQFQFALVRARVSRRLQRYTDVARDLEAMQEAAAGGGIDDLMGALRLERGLTEGALLRERSAQRHLNTAAALLGHESDRLGTLRAALWLAWFQAEDVGWTEAAEQADALLHAFGLLGCRPLETEAALVLGGLDIAAGRIDSAAQLLHVDAPELLHGVHEVCRRVLVAEVNMMQGREEEAGQRVEEEWPRTSGTDYFRPVVFASLQRQVRLWKQRPGTKPDWVNAWDVARGRPR